MGLPEKIDAFAERHLPPEPEAWCRRYLNKPKIIHDGLWGTFELQSHEVAFLTRPCCKGCGIFIDRAVPDLSIGASPRFEHTLGALYQIGRLCQALRAPYYKPDRRISEPVEHDARLAALLHDTGHGPFSHTSEQYFSAMDEIVEFQKDPLFQNSGAGEILSYLIVCSKPFQQFVRR